MGGVIGKLSQLSLADASITPADASSVPVEAEPGVGDAPAPCDTPQRKLVLLDPRSATLGIKRTPIILTRMKDTEIENTTPVKPRPYLETDLDEPYEGEESVTDSEHETDSVLAPDNISEEIKEPVCGTSGGKVDEIMSNLEEPVPIGFECESSDLEIISVEGKIMNSPAISKIKKAPLIFEDDTPVSESTPIKPKNGRTPLGVVSCNSSPLRGVGGGGKPWRGFQEERHRLGLENTPPPSAPFLDSVQSAPGKVPSRRTKKHSRANWALDESLII